MPWRWLKYTAVGLVATLMVVGVAVGVGLARSARQPIDTYLVLGGSIRREIYAAEQAQPQVPILISGGSQDPCIRLLFERAGTPLDQVWLEKCARSTFGNYYFTLPVLQRWHTRHVGLVTSGSHSQRALWMARTMLGAHRIWVTPQYVEEVGVPGNTESGIKTALDVARSVAWAIASQVYRPACSEVLPLAAVNLAEWRKAGFKCEDQAGIEGS